MMSEQRQPIQKNKSKVLSFVLLAILIMCVGAGIYYFFPRAEITGKSAELEKVTIGIQSNLLSSIVIVAKGRGYFEEEGLDVDLKKYPSGKLALLGMFADEVDISTAGGIPVMINSFTRGDFKIIGRIAKTEKGIWIMGRKDHGINSASDLKGKKIATQQNSGAHFFLSLFLTYNLISESDVELVFLKAVDLPRALINGEIDAFSMRNPFTQEAKDALGDNAIELFEPDIYIMSFSLIAKEDVIEQRPGLVKGIIRATIKAEEFMKENKGESIEIVAQEVGIENEALAAEWDIYKFGVSLDQALLITLEHEARWAIENKITNKTEIPNYLNFLYSDALKEIKPEAVSIIQ